MNPLVSFVAVTRNDNHGGDLNARTQAFISGLIAQLERHAIESELVLVEWNPPHDRPRLHTIFDWGDNRKYCSVRVICVPPDLHGAYKHAHVLPLYQMIGKNVGIRRAKGRFIIATNIDIIFDNEFFEFLKKGPASGVLYGVSRLDVDKHFPYNKSLDEQLQYCRNNVIRIHTRYGSRNCQTEDFSQIYAQKSILKQRLGILASASWELSVLAFRALCGHVLQIVRVRWLELGRYFPWLCLRAIDWHNHVIETQEFVGNLDHYKVVRHGHIKHLTQDRAMWVAMWLATLDHHKSKDRFAKSLRNKIRLHTNACGDFSMMDRESWQLLHGYSEYDGFSFHIDGLLVFSAHAAGIRQQELEAVRIYHIEHAAGSGFTPEHQEQLWQRLRERGIPYLDWRKLDELVANILEGKIDYRLASDSWGLRDVRLPEVSVDN
jgi:hypothetical protein